MTFIVVVEPNPLLRLGILHLLSKSSSKINLAGYDHLQLEQHVAEHDSCDLAVLSITRGDDIAVLVKKTEQCCSPKAILLLYDTLEVPPSLSDVSSLIAGCVYKHAAPEVLQAATQMVLAGGNCFPYRTVHQGNAEPLLSLYAPQKWPPPEQPAPVHDAVLDHTNALATESSRSTPVTERATVCKESEMLGLTPRQYEVLVLLARGHPMKTVGRQLNISVATAKAHTESLYQRLDVRNRNAAVYTAIARGATLGWESIANHHQVSQEH